MIRTFDNPQLNISLQTIRHNDQLYFKAKEVALALGYEEPKNAIRAHVPEEYRKRLEDIKGCDLVPLHPHTCFIMEPGLYALIFGSKLPAAKEFRRWVFEEVLPSIRKTGEFKALNKQMFKIENEFDLHVKVVDYIRRFHPQLLVIAGLGELQDTSNKRIKSWQKGYQKGQPDLIIANGHKDWAGLCLEFKTPKGNGSLSEAQKELLGRYEDNGYLIMVGNDYDEIIRSINKYCEGIRLPCECGRAFKTPETLCTHQRIFHRYNDQH